MPLLEDCKEEKPLGQDDDDDDDEDMQDDNDDDNDNDHDHKKMCRSNGRVKMPK